MIARLVWCAFGRWRERLRTPGFRASVRSLSRGSQFAGWNVLYGDAAVVNSSLGRFTYVSGGVVRNADIGSFTSIGPEVRIGGLGRHPTNMVTTHPAFYSMLRQSGITFADTDYFQEHARTKIGSDVWVGARSLILDGVNIGDGAIVGAGSVVTKDVPPYAIVGGVPARVIRYRFDEDQIARLLELQWWHWPIEKLATNSSSLRASHPSALSEKSAPGEK